MALSAVSTGPNRGPGAAVGSGGAHETFLKGGKGVSSWGRYCICSVGGRREHVHWWMGWTLLMLLTVVVREGVVTGEYRRRYKECVSTV
jgi:hypothetical protein